MTKARNIADLGSNDVIETTATGVDVTGTITADGLTVDGDVEVLSGTLLRTTNAGVTNPSLAPNLLRFEDNDPTKINNQVTGAIDWYSNDNDGTGVGAYINGYTNNTGGGYLTFGTGVAGTPLPRLTLSVNGDVHLYEDTGTTAKMVWSSSAESLGIGTSSPNANLDVTGSINIAGKFTSTATSKSNDTYTLMVDSSSHTSNMSSAGAMSVDVNSGRAFTITGHGNVGIGTASPASDVSFSGGVKLQTEDDTNTGYSGSGSGRLPSGTQISTRNAVASSSSLSGIGMLNRGPGGASMGSYIGSLSASSGWGASIVFGSTSGSSSHQERARIDSSGNLLVGKTSANGGVDGFEARAGGFTFITTNDANGACQITERNTGNSGSRKVLIVKGGTFNSTDNTSDLIEFRRGDNTVIGTVQRSGSNSVSYVTSSDYRLKENISTMNDASERVKALKPCRFNFIDSPEQTVDGFLAHEAQSVVPEAVTGTKDAVDAEGNPKYQGIDQSKLVPLLTKALQEALTKIEQLETRIETLENN